MIIVGITGTLGAGKGTIAEYLVKEKDFKHFSVRAYLLEEIVKRGLPKNRSSMVTVANELRENNSPSYIIEQLLKRAKESGKNVVIESVRAVGEAEVLKNGRAVILSVDAEQKLRYERALARNSEIDDISFEEFKSDEEREMSSDDPNKQSIASVMKMANVKIMNNGTIDELYSSIEEKLL